MGCYHSSNIEEPEVKIVQINRQTSLPFDRNFKILVCGESGVGKTCLINRLEKDEFNPNHNSTIGVDFISTKIPVNNINYKVQIWDTAGQERFKSLTKSFFRHTHAVIIVFDVTNLNSFNSLDSWITEVLNNTSLNYEGKHIPYIIIGNKIDQKDDRKVSFDDAKLFCIKKNCLYFETSAKYTNPLHSPIESLITKY